MCSGPRTGMNPVRSTHPAAQRAAVLADEHQRMAAGLGQGHQHGAVVGQLLGPVRRQVRTSDGDHDPVERGLLRGALEPVPQQDLDLRVPGAGQQPPGLLHHVLEHIHGDHQVLAAYDLGQQRRVVAGARAHLEDVQALAQVEELEHPGHQRGLRGGAGRHPADAPGGQRGVGVDEREMIAARMRGVMLDGPEALGVPVVERLEQPVPLDRPERPLRRRRSDGARRLELVRVPLDRGPDLRLVRVALVWRRLVRRGAHASCSRARRRAAMPRDVWLFTAPRLIFIAAAISASDKSA